ncbi:alpha-2-macroglobulin family protein [Ideonella sp. YS5]|uniref:alpha-2-macroglobulin family protein n=1 Tax=Ideonella sp. YS5 TaxID=3453714 RepID=UPI003EEB0841
MLAKINEKLGEGLARVVWLMRRAAGYLAPWLKKALGEWSPPAWVRFVSRGFQKTGAVLQANALLAALCVTLAGLALWQGPHVAQRWRAWAPAWMNVGLLEDDLGAAKVTASVVPPGVPDYANGGGPPPLVVHFSAPAAPPLRIGKEAADVGLSPEIAGRWLWVDATTLRFEPKGAWPIGEPYELTIGRKALAPHVVMPERRFGFTAAGFTASAGPAEFYQDPVQPGVRRVVMTIDFNHPVDPRSFESRVHLDDGSERKFSVGYDKFKLQATIQSEPLPIPAQTVAMKVTIDKGVTAQRGGAPTPEPLIKSVDVPGLYSLAISEVSASIVSNDAGDPEHVLHVNASMAVHEREFGRAVQAWMLPVSDTEGGEPFAWSDPAEATPAVLKRAKALKLEAIANEREVSEGAAFRMPQAEGGRFIFVRVTKGLKSPGGYLLAADRGEILQVKTFAPELSIMSRGSLLALSGEKKLPLLVRDLPGVSVDIARVLPQQLHLLVSQAEGDFSHPRFYGRLGEDHLAEHFERKIPLQLKPGKSHYETVDFADYLQAGGDRRGVFLLKVQGYNPADKPAAQAGGDAGDPSATEGEGAEGEGGYCCEGAEGQQIDATQVQDQRLVIVTDLGLIAKRAADGTREVFVQSIATGAPVAGARIEAWGRNGLVLASTNTDATGRATLGNLNAFTREKTPVLLLARKDGDLSFLPMGGGASLGRGDRTLEMSRFDVGGLRTSGLPNQMTAYLFSDRGIYRPGDTFHVGIVVKAANWATPLKDLPVDAEVVDARGLTVRRETLRLGPSGTAELSHATQESSPTGNYSITLSLPRQSAPNAPDVPPMVIGSTTVKVQEFLPDRTRVTARLSSEVAEGWVRPDDLKLKVDVQNLFGTPAQNRRIESRLTLTPAWPHFRSHPDFSFYDASTNRRPQVDDLGTAQTDDKGQAEVDLRLSRFEAATYQAHVLVKAFEPEGGRSVAAEAQSLVSDQPYLVGVKAPDSLGYINRNATRELQLIAIDPQARKMAVNGLKLVRVEHKVLSVLVKQNNGLYRYESRAKDVTLEEQALNLPAAGAKVALNTATPGNFALEVRNAEGLVLNRVQYAVAGAANLSRSMDRNAELQIRLNKKSYEPGEEIELAIQAPYTGAGLVTIERDKVYAHAWFKADKTASVQRITLPKDFEGNGYVNVQFVRDPSSDEIYTSPLSYGAVPFVTGLDRRTARIRLDAPALVKPGETLKMTLHSDKPARAYVFAVDEGILQVARYTTPDPLKHFFQKRALEVSTLQTLDLVLPEFRKLMQAAAPGGDGEGEAGKHLNPFKRKRDKPVAFWSGLVDVNGDREFSYAVPDSFNGAVRVMAVVVSDEAVAAASTTSTVRGDIVLLPTVPTSLAPGDTVDIGIGVSNNIAGSGNQAPIRLALAVNNGLEVVGEATQSLKVNEKGEASTVFHLRAKPGAQAVLGSASVVFTATHAKASARLSTDLSVRPASAFVTLLQSGTAVGAGELKSQLDAYPEFARSELSVSATPWAFASGLIRYLESYPHGCTEQISSQTLPAVVLAGQPELARELAKTRQGQGAAEFDPRATLARTVTQLRARQAADGGLAMWPGSSADEFATAYGLQLLLEARDRQLPVPPDLIAKANTYLQSRLAANDVGLYGWRTHAQMAYLLTRQGILVPAALANLREFQRQQARKAGDSWGSDIGTAYLAASFQLLKQDATANELMQPVWDDFVQRVKERKSRNNWDYYYDPLVHDSTLILLAARHFPKRLAALPTESWNRLATMIGNGWYSTQSSAAVILAVDAYARAAAGSAKGQFDASAVDKAGKMAALAMTGELRALRQGSVPAGSVKLRLSNPGELPLFYGWAESGYDRNLPEAAVTHGLEITQTILNEKGVAISEARIGEEVTVRVTVRAVDRDAARQVALVDILPSGLEPVLQSAGSDDAGDDTPPWMRRIGGSGSWQPDYVDVREDRVIFFGDVGTGTRDITFKARATNIGQFSLPAAFGEAMYERRVYGRSAAGKFSVLPVAK